MKVDPTDPRIQETVVESQEKVLSRYPAATSELSDGDNDGIGCET